MAFDHSSVTLPGRFSTAIIRQRLNTLKIRDHFCRCDISGLTPVVGQCFTWNNRSVMPLQEGVVARFQDQDRHDNQEQFADEGAPVLDREPGANQGTGHLACRHQQA